MTLVTYKNRRLDDDRLDAGESVFFLRQLESIDETVYLKKYPALMARQLLPPEANVPEWANARTYRQYDRQGVAHLISDESTMPIVDLTGRRVHVDHQEDRRRVRYSIDELKAAMAMNMPLDAARELARWNSERASTRCSRRARCRWRTARTHGAGRRRVHRHHRHDGVHRGHQGARRHDVGHARGAERDRRRGRGRT
jgi:hypothetical protein